MIPVLVSNSWRVRNMGGRLAGTLSGILAPEEFETGLLGGFLPYNVVFALYKAYTFAFIISSIPAYFGYYVRRCPSEIVEASTTADFTDCVS